MPSFDKIEEDHFRGGRRITEELDDGLSALLRAAHDDISDAESDISTSQGNISSLQGDMTTAQGNISTLQGDMTTAQGNISTLQGDMTTAQGNITNINQGIIRTSEIGATLEAALAAASSGDKVIINSAVTALTAISTVTDIEIGVRPNGSITLGDQNVTINCPFVSGRHSCFVYGGTGVVIFGKGSIEQILPEMFGAIGDGVTPDSSAIQRACDALVSANIDGPILRFGPHASYLMDNTVSFTCPERTKIYAEGSTFLSSTDQVCFNINKDADFAHGDLTVKRFITWIGGDFINSAGTRLSSIAIQGHLLRSVTFERIRFEGWWHGIEFAGKDTYLIRNCYFFDNEYSIIHPSGLITASGDVPIGVKIDGCVFSSDGVRSISIEDRIISLWIENNIFAGPSGKIYITNPLALSGESITIRSCEFEQNDGTVADIYIHDGVGNGGYYGVSIGSCFFLSGDIGWKGIKCERVNGLDITGCSFRDGSGGATEVAIDLDNNTTGVRIGQSNAFQSVSNKLVLGASFVRSGMVYEPEVRPVTTNGIVTGYNANTFSTGNAVIDMSSALSQFPPECVPRGYHIIVQALDSGSAGGVSLIRIKQESAAADQTGILLTLSGVPNSALFGLAGFVPCDSNGDIYIRYIATGVNTLTIYLRVIAIIM
jgi:hypothetical protein